MQMKAKPLPPLCLPFILKSALTIFVHILEEMLFIFEANLYLIYGNTHTTHRHTQTQTLNVIAILHSPVWPLGYIVKLQPFSFLFTLSVLFSGSAQLKDKSIPECILGAKMKSAVKLPSCSCPTAVSDGHLSAVSPSQMQTKGPLMPCLSLINLHLFLLDFNICFSVIWFYIQYSLTLLIN